MNKRKPATSLRLLLLLAVALVAPLPGLARSTDALEDDLPQTSAVPNPPASQPIWSAPDGSAGVVTVPPPPRRAESAPTLSLNPLWAIPLNTLSATRERPIFSASRRPRPTAVSAVARPKAPPPRPREPERPQLSLVGTIASDSESFAIFVDGSKTALRLRIGDAHQGWTLRAVDGREATLEKDQQAAVLSLPQTGKAGEVRMVPAADVSLISAKAPDALTRRREH